MGSQGTNEWKQIKEVSKTGLGIKFTSILVRIFPHNVLIFFTRIVAFFYFVCCRQARKASIEYQKALLDYCKNKTKNGNPLKPNFKKISSYKHILSFAMCIVEKIEGWSGLSTDAKMTFNNDDVEKFRDCVRNRQGCMLLCSHLGNVELVRSIITIGDNDLHSGIPMAVIMDQKVTENFNKTIAKLNHKAVINVISSDNIGLDTISVLQETIDNGGLVIIAADRISANNPDRFLSTKFLGKDAKFPYGPFLISALLKAPVFYMFSLRKNQLGYDSIYSINIKKADVDFNVSRKERDCKIKELFLDYANTLEQFCILNPYQWYNFYNFWGN